MNQHEAEINYERNYALATGCHCPQKRVNVGRSISWGHNILVKLEQHIDSGMLGSLWAPVVLLFTVGECFCGRLIIVGNQRQVQFSSLLSKIQQLCMVSVLLRRSSVS